MRKNASKATLTQAEIRSQLILQANQAQEKFKESEYAEEFADEIVPNVRAEVAPPLQLIPPPVNTEVTVTVEEIGAVVPLVAINEAMLPLPDATKPTAVLELAQVYEFPVPLKAIAALFEPLHKV